MRSSIIMRILKRAYERAYETCISSEKRAYECGIMGKTWRLLRSWYTAPKSCVPLNGKTSEPHTMECGLLQGLVLSPTLFLLVLDPLLQHLEKNQLDPCVAGLYVGGFAHADYVLAGTPWTPKLEQWKSL